MTMVSRVTGQRLGVGSLVNQTVFRERACASERGRGGRENTSGSRDLGVG